MMMNKIPANTSLQSILNYLDTSTKWGARNRALFAVRQQLRIKDIAHMSISSVVNLDASIRRFVVAPDGKRFDLSAETQAELQRYIHKRFSIKSLEELTPEQAAAPLFNTQKEPRFSPNTLAQHFSQLDKLINQQFQVTEPSMTAWKRSGGSIITAPAKKSHLARLIASVFVAGVK